METKLGKPLASRDSLVLMIALVGCLMLMGCMAFMPATMKVSGICLNAGNLPIHGLIVRMKEIGAARLLELPPIATRHEIKTGTDGRFEFEIARHGNWLIEYEENSRFEGSLSSALPIGAQKKPTLFVTIRPSERRAFIYSEKEVNPTSQP